ncbi:MAG: SRPBCC domain-containing protein [Terracidiphilus sp.]|jgi:uncharacterized protein YndB with AHSA1/START domain
MTDTAPTRSLIIEREFTHPPEKVWRALTEGQLLAQWMMENDFQPVVGHRFTFHATPVPNWNGIVDCEVLLVEPPRSLSYRWGIGSDGGTEWVVTLTLTPTPAGTHLRMEQSGFRPDQTAAFRGAQYGWQKFIGNLENVVGGLK